MSSLTDNYPSKGRFVKFGSPKGALATFGFQTQLDNIVDTSPPRETKSPWYVQPPQNIETNEIPNLGQGSDNTSSSSSINNIPEKELMTSFTRDHLDDLVRYPPPKPPPLQRLSSSFHRRASDLDSSRAGRSEGFLTYVQEQYILSRRKKLISGVIVVFFVCVIVIVVVAFNTQNNSNVNEEEANTIYQVEPPHDHDTLSSAGNSAFNETVLDDLSSVEYDDDTNDVSSGTSTTAAVILTTDPTEQTSQETESTTTSTTTATTSDIPSTSTDPTIPGWLNDLLALASTTTPSTTTTTSSTTTTASTTTSQKTPTISPTYKPTFRSSISPSTSSKESPTTTTYPTKSPSTGSSTSTSSSVPSTMPSTTQINKCTVKCEEDAIQKFDREIDKLVDKCIEESAFNENCQDEKKCKKECKKVAEKREDDVLKKVNNDAIKCKEICRNNAPNDTLLAVDRDVVVVVNNNLSNRSKQDKSAPDETEFRWMELFP